MRIAKSSPDRLVLRDRTLWITYVCCGVAVLLVVVFGLEQGDHRILYPAAIFALFGLAFLRSTDAEFDKQARVCRLSQRNVLRVSRRQLGFDEIDDVRIEYGPLMGNSQIPTCRLCLVTNNAVVPLTAAFEGYTKRYDAMREAVVEAMWADKSHVGASDPVLDLVKADHLTEAVRILRLRDGLDLATATARVADMRVRDRS